LGYTTKDNNKDNTLIKFSVRHPVSVLMIVCAVFLAGLCSVFLIPVDMMPRLSVNKMIVACEYEGVPAAEIRKMITMPLEDSLASLKGVKHISSVSRDGLSLITVEIHNGVDIDIALVECREIIDLCYETLPSQCKKPAVIKNDAALNETVSVVIFPKNGDDTGLVYERYLVDNDIKPRFLRIEGVGAVNVSGGSKEEVQIVIHREKIENKKIVLADLSDNIKSSNYEYPAGNILEGEREFLVKTTGLYKSLDEIKQSPVSYGEGGLVKLKDIADVNRSTEDRDTFFIYEGKNAVKLGIYKRHDFSPLLLSKEIKNEVEHLKNLYGNDFEFKITGDSSENLVLSMLFLLASALTGVIVTYFVLFYFLRTHRLSLIISVIIPVTLAASVLVLAVCGRSLNVISLSGITIGIGMVIDASSVVIENLSKHSAALRGSALSADDAAEWVDEVKLSNIGSTLTTVIVFLPVLFISGIINELFSELSIAVITSISVACVLSLTFIPASFMLLYSKNCVITQPKTFINGLIPHYRKLLSLMFKKKIIIALLFLIILVMGAVSLFFLKVRLFNAVQTDDVDIELVFPYNTTTDYMEKVSNSIYEHLSPLPYIKELCISGGIEKDNYILYSNPELIKEKILIHFAVDAKRHKKSAVQKQVLDFLNSGRDSYKAAIIESAGSFAAVLNIFRENLLVCTDKIEDLLPAAYAFAGENDISPNETTKEFMFIPDRDAAARFQISTIYTASVVHNALEGVECGDYYENGRAIPLKIVYAKKDIDGADKIGSLSIITENSSVVPLRALGRVEENQVEKTLYRYDRKDSKIIKNCKFNNNIDLIKGGGKLINTAALETESVLNTGAFLLAGVVLLLYLAMGAQFESFMLPLLFLIALPPAFSGAFFFLLILGKSIDINSIIALIILFGISVNNSIILYENCKLQKAITEASVIEACSGKFRTIIITNSTTVLALLPFAFDPFNNNSQSNLAVSIIGGLIVSTIIVLFAAPSIFCSQLKGRQIKDNAGE